MPSSSVNAATVASRLALPVAFTASGVAGLVYELVWTRYLALLVGHSAFAQVLVLAIYLGGTAVGSLLVAERSRGSARPLRAYALVETALAGFGLLFHVLFLAAQGLLYGVLVPWLGDTVLGGIGVWAVAIALIVPQAVLLGATFPLMAAGLVRRRPDAPGSAIADVYVLNTVGGAAGVLVGGFALVPWLGLPGASAAAAVFNLAAAALSFRADAPSSQERPQEPAPLPYPSDRRLVPLLLTATLCSALASFLYEIGWIRMLSLVLGSATHSFELMLSAFLLGLGLGSLLVRPWADRAVTPVRLLGAIQWTMGLAALLTLPLYAESFPAMSWLVRTLPKSEGGYLLFNLSRYGLALFVMLPATMLAGMTLPLVTATLLRAGSGERVIGQAYGANTVGSVVGAIAGGLLLLPGLGLEGILAFGAALDMAVGIALLAAAARPLHRRTLVAGATAAVTAALVAGIVTVVELDRRLLTSGVYRAGEIPALGSRRILFYRDGATASVGVHRGEDAMTVLTTNGKADASLPVRWIQRASGQEVPKEPISGEDESTQVMAPLILLAHNPDARVAAVIGHGSGMSAHLLLGSPAIERLTTIEIEPEMILGSQEFLPANQRVFDDPRSRFLLDDARSALAGTGEPFDLIFSEPSNPWVSGVASLFTIEFYGRVRDRLSDDGVFGQWFQLYEMEDELLLSVLAAIDRTFPDWSAWLVGSVDVLIVAGKGQLPPPDWGVVELPGIRADLSIAPLPRAGALSSLLMFGAPTLRPLLQEWPVNSDFRPLLDVRAERARYLGTFSQGLFAFATHPVNVHRLLQGEPLGLLPYDSLSTSGVAPLMRRAVAGWLATGGRRGELPPYPDFEEPLSRFSRFRATLTLGLPVTDWAGWMNQFGEVEQDLHARTAGYVDSTFYNTVADYLERQHAPDEASASVDLLRELRGMNFDAAAEAADRLDVGSAPKLLLPPLMLLDASVVAYLGARRPLSARAAYDRLAPLTGRGPRHARNLVLDALVREATLEAVRGNP